MTIRNKLEYILLYIQIMNKTIMSIVNVPWAQKLLLALVGLETVTIW